MSRQSIAASALGHALVVWVLFIFVPLSPARVLPNTIQVALVNLPAGRSMPARGVPSDAPAPKKAPEPKAEDKEAAAPEKNAVRPPDTKKATPRRPTPGLPQGATGLPSVAMGVAGLSGSVAVDGDFRWTYWLLAVRSTVDRNWGGSPGIVTGGKPVRCTVYFRVDRGGRVSNVKLTESSGVAFFDQKALRAVTVSDPLVRLPEDYANDWVGVHFGFEYSDQ